MFTRYSNPNAFAKLALKAIPVLWVLFFASLTFGLLQALYISPPDYKQGYSVRIMYVHVPSAWLSMAIYANIAIASIIYLVWKHSLADIIARSSAGIGAIFTLITLVTGSLWGKPMWGAWWVWDARLTSVLILFFIYISYIYISKSFDSYERSSNAAAIFAIAGLVNLPIIKFSVDWWSTLHQPASIIRSGGVAVHETMLIPLFSMAACFLFLYLIVLFYNCLTHLNQKKIDNLRLGGM